MSDAVPSDPRQAAPEGSAPRGAARQVAVLVGTDSSLGRRIIRGIAYYADRHANWHLLIDPRDHEHRPTIPDGWRGHGIVAHPMNRQQLETLQRSGLPIVNIDDLAPPMPGVASVLTDEDRLAEMALGHLLDRGFRTFGYFAPPSLDYSTSRRDAFHARVQAAGAPWVEYKPGYRPGRRIGWAEQQKRVERWIRSLPRPIAVLAIDAPRARQLAEICHLAGVRVPDDVAILAGSLDDLMCDVATPPLSSVNVASERIGHDAALTLDRMMRGEAAPAKPIRVPPRGVASRHRPTCSRSTTPRSSTPCGTSATTPTGASSSRTS